MIRTILTIVSVAAIVWLATAFSFLPRPTKAVQENTITGNEQPEMDGLFINGFNVCSTQDKLYPACRAFYEQHASWLGEPIGSYNGRSQQYVYATVTVSPGNKEGWQVETANDGWSDMERSGYQPKPGSQPHPLIRQWLLEQQEAGLDIPRLVGRVISDPICLRRTCTQWFDKIRLSWAENETSTARVSRHQIGLWLAHPDLRPKDGADDNQAGFVNLAAVACGVVGTLIGIGIGSMVTRRRGGNRRHHRSAAL